MKKIRLFVDQDKILSDEIIRIEAGRFDYLIKVMRKKINDEILIFNGRDGEYLAHINSINKKDCEILVLNQTKQFKEAANITLAFAPVKNVRIDFIAAKATELGIASFQPIITDHSIVNKINYQRFNANIREAAEQCERLDLPTLKPIVKLKSLIKNLSKEQILILCDESGKGRKASEVLSKINHDENRPLANEIIPSCNQSMSRSARRGGRKRRLAIMPPTSPKHDNLIQRLRLGIIIFIGPEGGFSEEEFKTFRSIKNLHSISLGPRILRADTAIISAITLVQEFLGDF